MHKTLALTLVTAIALTVSACGGSPEPTTSSTLSNPETKKNETVYKMGEPVTNSGAVITVKSATESPTVLLDEKGKKKGYGQKIDTLPTNSGAKFVTVTTNAKNDGTKPWNLTCSHPIDGKLITPRGAEMAPIQNLYLIPNNPDCGDYTNPGFETEMSWIFEVPTDLNVSDSKFAFYESETNYGKPSMISLAP